jgi:Glycosyl hydrolase family 9/Cellulase N-terminal ig-like domain
MKIHRNCLALCFLLCIQTAFAEPPKILTNHIGYEKDGPKQAVVLGHAGDDIKKFKLLDDQNGKEILSGDAKKVGPVDQWKDWIFWTIDFTPAKDEGTYRLECTTNKDPVHSFPFLIQKNLLERNTLSSVIYYFKGQRCSGLLDKADCNLKFEDKDDTADVHGGWYDATGDYGKHLSHLSFSTYFNPQQIPLGLFKTYEVLRQRDDPNLRQYKRRLLDEAMFGADHLVRVKNPDGSFYRSIGAPGGEKKPEDRRIGKEGKNFAIKTLETKEKFKPGEIQALEAKFPYEVGYRAGGGIAIAALALASRYEGTGEFSRDRYLQTAKDAFEFLEKHNPLYTNDGKENIVDDYCALLAATELYWATVVFDATDTQREVFMRYKSAADRRAKNLMDRLITTDKYGTYWRADDADRPFFHAADAGMPVVALLNYYQAADETTQKRVLETVRRSLEAEMRLTEEVANPFGYARQLVQSKDSNRRTAFFFPHDTETAPWWQGENARLGSLASAARLAAPHFKDDAAFYDKLQAYATNQLNWILGLNPFDSCMLGGAGRNNPPYMFFNSYEYTNAPGGIVNGITSGYNNEHDIDFNLPFSVTSKDEDWRWGEQWLPHAAWYLYAISLPH